MGKSGENWKKWGKVVKSGEKLEKVGEKWGKVGKIWKKLGKVDKSGEKLEKVGKNGDRWENVLFLNFGQNGRRRPFWMSENNFRSQFLPFQIDTQLVLKFLDKMAAGGHFGLDDNVSYRTRPRYLDE